ncbi:peptidylprolyl isomerase [Paraburkholderia sediminicola]|uniref:peptidylprolyl isomerase n=1 Tax=Paraburkholderia sediminicola TaxID=458836 RepID=UPI0038BC51FA
MFDEPKIEVGGAVSVTFDTPLGRLKFDLDPERAPVTVANFLRHVEADELDAAEIYRIVAPANRQESERAPIDVVQWGTPIREGFKSSFPPIEHEPTSQTGILHKDGVLSMARREPGTASSHFFICVGDQPALDYGGARQADGLGFAAFGWLSEGRHVLQRIFERAEASEWISDPLPMRRV